MTYRVVTACAAVLFASITLPAAGGGQPTLQPAGVDLGVGLAIGRGGGVRHGRDGLGASALVAWRGRTTGSGAPLLGVLAGAQGVIGSDDMCAAHPRLRCAPKYPGIQSLGLVAGWEARRGARGSAARVFAGPAAFRSEEDATALGLQGRVDLATSAVARVALVAWGQGGLVPRLRGDTYRMASFGIGIRVR